VDRWEALPESRNNYHLAAGDPEAPTINAKNIDGGSPRSFGSTHHQHKNINGGPWEAVPEVRLRPPSTQKMLMVGPLGGGAGGLVASTINEKMSTADPLGGSVRGPGAPTINAKNIDGRPPGRWCQSFWSTHHQRKKCQR
jgi:hypothetical protein